MPYHFSLSRCESAQARVPLRRAPVVPSAEPPDDLEFTREEREEVTKRICRERALKIAAGERPRYVGLGPTALAARKTVHRHPDLEATHAKR